MPQIIVKANPDEDLYVSWSTIVDGPAEWGTRAEMIDEYGHDPERLDRADRTGTSAYDHRLYGWNDDTFVVMNGGESRGLLPRTKLAEYLNILTLTPDDTTAADHLLEPLD